MLQEISSEKQEDVAALQSFPKTKDRSLKQLPDDTLPDCYMTVRKSPKLVCQKDKEDCIDKAFLASV